MRLAMFSLLLVITGCSNRLADPNGVALNDVLQRIKTEVGVFQLNELRHSKDLPLDNACRGYINLHITKVQMTLSTALVTTSDGSVTIGLPVPTGTSLGLSFGGTHTVTNSENLTFTSYPQNKPINAERFNEHLKSLSGIQTPLATTLIQLREALLRQSDHEPCFALQAGDDDPGNTISFSIEIDSKGHGGIGFTYSLFSLNASHSKDSDYINKIEISFSPYLNPERVDATPRKMTPRDQSKPLRRSAPREEEHTGGDPFCVPRGIYENSYIVRPEC